MAIQDFKVMYFGVSGMATRDYIIMLASFPKVMKRSVLFI